MQSPMNTNIVYSWLCSFRNRFCALHGTQEMLNEKVERESVSQGRGKGKPDKPAPIAQGKKGKNNPTP